MLAIVSSSLSNDSKSRVLAKKAAQIALEQGINTTFIDLQDHPLPICGSEEIFSHPNVAHLKSLIRDASGIILATPIYTYSVSASLKNFVELVGRELEDKAVGLIAAAGGERSFMSPLGLLNGLMLDYRSVIVPRFVYATGASFEGEFLSDPAVAERLKQLVISTSRLGQAQTDISSKEVLCAA